MIDTFKRLAENLSDKQKAEYYAILHELEINPKADMELARLLQVLQLYKAHYETIPEAIQRASTDILKPVQKTMDSIDRLLSGVKTEGERIITRVRKEGDKVVTEIRKLAVETERSAATCQQSTATSQMLLKQFNEDAKAISDGVSEHMGKLLSDTLKEVWPLEDFKNVWQELSKVIKEGKEASVMVRKSARGTRWIHVGYFAAAWVFALVIAFISMRFYDHLRYEEQLAIDRVAMSERYEKNNEVLLELDKLKREISTRIHSETGERLFIIDNATRSYNNQGSGCVIAVKK
jgi:hypothetical protein